MAHAAPTDHGAPHGAPGAPPHHLGIHPLAHRPRVPHVPIEEEIYGIYHHHYIVFLQALVFPILALVIALALFIGVNAVRPEDVTGWVGAVLSVGGVLLLLVLVGIGLWIVYTYMDWRDDHLVVSSVRVVEQQARPGVSKFVHDVPIGKVQNVISHHAGLSDIPRKIMKVGSLIIDTAGVGQLVFHDISEKDAHDARTIILALQKDVREASKTPRELYRHQVVRSIIYGTPMPAQPRRNEAKPSPRMGYNRLNIILPRRPWREGLRVTWHRHWWFLLAAEAMPLILIVVFEVTNLIIALVGNALGIVGNPILGIFAVVRPIFYLLMLPFAFWQWEDWRNDKYVLDKDNLIVIDTLPFGLDETVKQTEIRRVVDASWSRQGVVQNLLNFGNVVMKTPGEKTEFVFEGVGQPQQIHREIIERIEAQREQEQVQWDRDIQEWLRTYVDERRAEPLPAPPPPVDNWPFW